MAGVVLNGSLANGGEAAAHVAYALSDVVVLQPTVEGNSASGVLGPIAAQWAAQGRDNAFGKVPTVVQLEGSECTGAQLVAHIERQDEDGGIAGAVLSGSSVLVKMLPNLLRLAANRVPCVLHVAALRMNAEQTTVETDLSDISALRDAGIVVLASSSTQEVHDLGVIAHVAAAKLRLPIINFFDGTRLASELGLVKLAEAQALGGLMPSGMSTSSPVEVVEYAMASCAEVLGKRYNLFEYTGPADAENVVVAMGTTAKCLVEAVRHEMAQKQGPHSKTGVLRVLMLRPWSPAQFLAALPASTKRVCVLDQNKSGENDTPLFKDVAAAFHSDVQWVTPVLMSGNVVVNNKAGLTPSFTKAILDNLVAQSPRHRFLLSDLEVQSPFSGDIRYSSALVKQTVSWTLGERAKESRHALSVVLGPFLNIQVQQSDSVSAQTGVCRTDLRFAPFEIASAYTILGADVIALDDAGLLLLPHVDVLAQARKGTKLVINGSWTSAKQADLELSASIRARIASIGVELYAVDASTIGQSYSNWLMQAVVALLSDPSFVTYRQIVAHLIKLVENNVPGGIDVASYLEESKLRGVLSHIEYDQEAWAAAASDEDTVAPGDFVPFDMLPRDVLVAKDGGVNNEGPTSVLAYRSLLNQLFGQRLVVADTTGGPVPRALEDKATAEASLEMCFGRYLVKDQARKRLVEFVQQTVSNTSAGVNCSKELLAALGMWHGIHDNAFRCGKVVPRLIDLLAEERHKSSALEYIYENRGLLHKSSKWIIGGDNWAYDLSNSGIQHIINSGQDINVLIFDSGTYTPEEDLSASLAKSDISETDLNSSAMSVISGNTTSHQEDHKTQSLRLQQQAAKNRRKKDIGLYAMNYGTAYVASISVLASQSQAMKALAEADGFKGPSIILAHAPRIHEAIVDMHAEQERLAAAAVDEGSWPLYRWNPALEVDEFSLDSSNLKAEIKDFLKREQNLSLLANATPVLPDSLGKSLESERTQQHTSLQQRATQRRINEQFDQLVDSVGSAGTKNLELLVLYGSDGGNASGVAEKLAKKAEVSGCGEVRCMEANDFEVDNLAEEKHVILVLATAGQGEPCANAKNFTETLLSYPNKLPGLKFAVFGLGDSHYWGEGSADSERYFCLNAKMVDDKLGTLGADRITLVGLGDDQADDGYDTALGEWEANLWSTLQVKIKGGDIGGAPQIVDDDIKVKSNFLRGMIDEGLADLSTGKLLPEDTKLTKFHGIYQQDLRSVREELDAKGLERAYSFMIRIGVPGGVGTSEQYIAMDDLCTRYANGALKLTTRQAYQFHGVLKKNLKTTMKGINRAAMDTLAACGDVNRNVIANPHHRNSGVHKQVSELSRALQAHLRPKTSAYAEIWLDKKPVAGSVDHEPIYGVTYLPRKFKIAIAVPPLNDVDVFSHCLGLIAIVENGKLLGYNVSVGGGMGTTHGNKATYPRLGDIMGFCTPEQAVQVAEAVVLVQRDHGERENRKHARLKYTVEDMGLNVFRSKVEAICGFKLGKDHPFKFNSNADPYGWHQGEDGTWEYTLFVENGYVKDTEDYKIKTALREIAENHPGGEMNLTATQNIIIGAIPEDRKPLIESIMQKYHLDNTKYSAMRLHSMACVALPTCALAMAESQTYLPSLIAKIEVLLDRNGLRHDAITIRMTGCPNGCGRPAMAEIGFIGKAPGQYNMYLGGGFAGNRVSKMYREGVNEEEILSILGPMLESYATTRQDGEFFGDFCIRTGIIEPTLQGSSFWATGKDNVLTTPSGTTQIYW